MHRMQIYIEEPLFLSIKAKARSMNISVSVYIRDTLRKELETEPKKSQKAVDFSGFTGMWQDHDITQSMIRSKAWKS